MSDCCFGISVRLGWGLVRRCWLLPLYWGLACKHLGTQVLPHGQSVVVVASLEATEQGNQLIAPLGDRLQVLIGTEAGIRQQGQQLRVLFLILAIPLGFTSFMVTRSAQQLRQAFVERSNQ